MRNLLNFLIKYNHWLLFIFLELICFVLLFRFNRYQGSVFFTSANYVSSSIYSMTSSVNSYFNLRTTNEQLLDRNMALELEVISLKQMFDSVHSGVETDLPPMYDVMKARVIKNSINKSDNYITLNKGRDAGIEPDMGVIGPGGVVGIVYMVSRNRALVISALNSKASISCKIVKNNYFGNLKWDGGSSRYAYLYDLPNHAEVNVGDSIVTSGYSTVFPEGVQVGVVEDKKDSNDGLSYIIKVRLSTDFGNLNDVRVIRNKMSDEQNALEQQIPKRP